MPRIFAYMEQQNHNIDSKEQGSDVVTEGGHG